MVWWKNPCFICLCVWEILIKRKTSIALQLHVSVLPKPYVDLHDTNPLHKCALLLLWASSNFVTLVRFLSYLFDQDHVHSTSWTSTLEVSYAIPSIHKIKLHVEWSLSLVSLKWGMGYRKEKREKMACPRSMTQKKNIVILPCNHVIQIKGERDS